MSGLPSFVRKVVGLALATMLCAAAHAGNSAGAGPEAWANDLSPISPQDWSYDRAAHLLERAGFGGTPEQIERLAHMTPRQAVAHLVRFQDADTSRLPAFDESGIFDPGIEPFPPSRPATTEEAKARGESLG